MCERLHIATTLHLKNTPGKQDKAEITPYRNMRLVLKRTAFRSQFLERHRNSFKNIRTLAFHKYLGFVIYLFFEYWKWSEYHKLILTLSNSGVQNYFPTEVQF